MEPHCSCDNLGYPGCSKCTSKCHETNMSFLSDLDDDDDDDDDEFNLTLNYIDNRAQCRLSSALTAASDETIKGARSKQGFWDFSTIPLQETKSNSQYEEHANVSLSDSEGSPRLYRWRKAGQAVRRYLDTQGCDQSSSLLQADTTIFPGDHECGNASHLCTTCWNVNDVVSSASSTANGACVYADRKATRCADSGKWYKDAATTANCEDLTSSPFSSFVASEQVASVSGECHDLSAQYVGETFLPLFDRLHAELNKRVADKRRQKSGLLSDRRKHHVNERSKHRPQYNFTDSSSSDNEVTDETYQNVVHRRRQRQTTRVSDVERSQVGLFDCHSEDIPNNMFSCKPSKERSSMSTYKPFRSTTLTKDICDCPDATACNQVICDENVCSSDTESFNTSTSELISIGNTDTDNEIAEGPAVDTDDDSNSVLSFLSSSHSSAVPKLFSKGQLHRLSSLSESSLSDCNNPFHLVGSVTESTSAAPGPFTDAKTPCMDSQLSEVAYNHCSSSSRAVPLFLLPNVDADTTLLANCVDNLTVSDTEASIGNMAWDFSLQANDSEADDEFECDCPVCLMNRDHIRDMWRSNNSSSVPEDTNSASSGGNAGQFSFSFDEPTNYINIISHGDVLESLFQDVIVQMLQVYPDIFASHTPPPVSAEDFEKLKSFRVVQSELGSDTACTICLCPFEDGEDAKCLPCRHAFHTLCIQAWLNKAGTCPVCRDDVLSRANTEDQPDADSNATA